MPTAAWLSTCSAPTTPDFQDTRELSARTGLDYQGNGLSLSAGLAYADVRRDYDTGFGPSSFTGRSWRADIKGRADIADRFKLDFGADTEWTRSTSSFDPDARRAAIERPCAARLVRRRACALRPGCGSTITTGLAPTGPSGPMARSDLGDDWRLARLLMARGSRPRRCTSSTAFVGNPALRPETSRSFEAGIDAAIAMPAARWR